MTSEPEPPASAPKPRVVAERCTGDGAADYTGDWVALTASGRVAA